MKRSEHNLPAGINPVNCELISRKSTKHFVNGDAKNEACRVKHERLNGKDGTVFHLSPIHHWVTPTMPPRSAKQE